MKTLTIRIPSVEAAMLIGVQIVNTSCREPLGDIEGSPSDFTDHNSIDGYMLALGF